MTEVFGNLASASGYGGYGGGYEKEIDCNSALGLLGLLGLIELLRDIIERVIMKDRRKRSVEPLFSLPGGQLIHTIPAVLIPLLHSAVDTNDGFESPACLERSICQANRILTSQASTSSDAEGFLADLASSLLSQVVAKSFTEDRKSYLRVVEAGEAGRKRKECELLFPGCRSPLSNRHTPRPGVNISSLIQAHLNSV